MRNPPAETLVLPVEKPVWFAGQDIVASIVLTGKVPEIIKAIRIVPHGQQPGMRPFNLRGVVEVDPYRHDLNMQREFAKIRAPSKTLYAFIGLQSGLRTNRSCYASVQYGWCSPLLRIPEFTSYIIAGKFKVDGTHSEIARRKNSHRTSTMRLPHLSQ